VKVVIFCGGMGVRMGEATQLIPKPMIRVGSKPILWHIMKWYASWGHTEFILCLGYRAETVKEYFLTYNEAVANDFVLDGREVELLASDLDDWRITFLDTGLQTSVSDRLLMAKPHLAGDDTFLATYGDGLTDAPLDDMIATLDRTGKSGIFLSVRPRLSYHVVHAAADGVVDAIAPISSADVRINGGFFVLRRAYLDDIGPHEEIMEGAMQRLVDRKELLAYRYDGFWAPMDTIKDKQDLDAIVEGGAAPWLIGPRSEASR
jgi:glucose-1-phosphate cytidylyltransferase